MSVYVSITCYKYDRELIRTIESCFAGAEGDVIVGLEYCGTEEFKAIILSNFGGQSNFRFMYTPLEQNVGIGQGRINAASMYSGEDYFLQIDSHTKFSKNWDTILIDKFEKAKLLLKNERIVLTGNLSAYTYIDFEKNLYKTDNKLMYTHWLANDFLLPDMCIPAWNPYEIDETPKPIIDSIKETGFAPASKIVAMFMFSDHYLPENLSIPSNIIFWEEEIVQSIELIANKFTLVFPGFDIPIAHFYGDKNKDNVSDTRTKSHLHRNAAIKMDKNFRSYIDNGLNSEKIKAFEKYNGISIKYGTKLKNAIPKSYINISNNDIIS